MIRQIDSPNNPLIKQVSRLRKARDRKKENLMVIEGGKEIRMAIDAGFEIANLFYTTEAMADLGTSVKEGAVLCRVSREVMDKMSIRENVNDFVALAKPKYAELKDIKPAANALVLVLESLEKPGNLGAVLRTADACGADGVIVNDMRTDIYNHNVIRASLGAIFSVPVVVCAREAAVKWLKANNIKTYASTPHTDNSCYNEDYRPASAFVVGTEHEGLSDEWLGEVDRRISIPMQGKVDSLNASVSAAVLAYEALRQRQI